MIVQPIPVGTRLIDTVADMGPSALAAARDCGAEGIIAYLGGNLTRDLIANAFALRLGIVPVNFSRGNAWAPSAQLGELDATTSTKRLVDLGVPTVGLYDWIDLEGCGSDPTAYLNACGRIVADQGRKAGLYVGSGGLLSGAQLYALPAFTGYWRSLSRGIPEPQCGFMLSQVYPSTMCGGTLVDFDFAARDFEGRAATWLFPD